MSQSLTPLNWKDPMSLVNQLTEEERMISQTRMTIAKINYSLGYWPVIAMNVLTEKL